MVFDTTALQWCLVCAAWVLARQRRARVTRACSVQWSGHCVSTMSETGLVNPVLAFIKAFCLRGDRDRLVQIVSERFDAGSQADAKKLLWDKCKSDLVGAGLSFHVRRNALKLLQSLMT